MRLNIIKLRLAHDGKHLGVEIDCSRQAVFAEVKDGVLVLESSQLAMGALGRFGRALYRESKKPPKNPEVIG